MYEKKYDTISSAGKEMGALKLGLVHRVPCQGKTTAPSPLHPACSGVCLARS